MPKTTSEKKSSPGLLALSGLIPFLKPYHWQFLLAGVSLLLAASATLSMPFSFRQIIDFGFGTTGDQQAEHINLIFSALLGIASILAIATACRFYIISWLGERITADIRQAVYGHVIEQSPEFFEITQSGEVLSRINTDTVLIQTLIGTSISMAIRNFLLLTGGLVMMFVTSIKLSLLIVVLLIAVVVPIVMMSRRVRKLSKSSQDKIADASALAGEKLNAVSTIQAFTNEHLESNIFNQFVEVAFNTAKQRIRARAFLTVIAIFFGFGAIIFILWLGTHAVMAQKMSGGELSQFILYAAIVAGGIGGLAEVMGDTQRAMGASERLLELLALKPHITNPTHPKELADIHQYGVSLKVNHLGFHYPSNPQSNALSNISFQIEPGQRIAIVGPSGAGKTSLFQLLLRFYDPQSGSIQINDIDIRDLSLESLRKTIGIVAQDVVIFSTDAMENIRYGKPEASDEEVFEAARLAAADEFILRLPQGYQTFLGDRGIRLSGGQRQRIAIARTLLKNPALLLLDEATSALDAESERLVQQALETAMNHRTTLVIAHRLSTVKQADAILVLENGHIVETGNHASLIAKSGLYSHLAKLQFTEK